MDIKRVFQTDETRIGPYIVGAPRHSRNPIGRRSLVPIAIAPTTLDHHHRVDSIPTAGEASLPASQLVKNDIGLAKHVHDAQVSLRHSMGVYVES